jgi:hypothetical protein
LLTKLVGRELVRIAIDEWDRRSRTLKNAFDLEIL